MARSATAIFALLIFSFANTVHAGEFYGGVKAGVVDPSASGFGATSTASLQLGYEFADLWVFDAAIEGEVTRSITDGDGPGGDYSYAQNSIFGSLRTAGPLYVIARAGLIDAEIEQASGTRSDDGIAYGLGLGFSTGIRWEIEWTTYEFDNDDVDLISLSLSF